MGVQRIVEAVGRHGGKHSAAARELGLAPSTVGVAMLREENRRLKEAIKRGHWRLQDLMGCERDDDCALKADGAELVLTDIEAYLSASQTPAQPDTQP